MSDKVAHAINSQATGTKMHSFDRLDLMIAYSCNISCEGCISLSDRKRSGIEPYEALEASFKQWKHILNPGTLTLFGGEPCLHPRLIDICRLVRQTWPTSIIRLITNGYLLNRFAPQSWFIFSPFEIQVSIHRKDHEKYINDLIKPILRQKQSWKVKMHSSHNHHKQLEWSTDDFKIYKSIFKDFVVPYKKNVDRIMPWHSDPAQAHAICGAPATPILFKGKLYKCPAVANTIDLTGERWFDYKGYTIDDDIEEFVKNINRPEPVCAQCPDSKHAVIVDHFDKRTVVAKIKHFD
jgi:organic radical activating enzyme